MSVKVVVAPRRVRGVRVERACSSCAAVFSFVPSDVRQGVSQGDGRGRGRIQYRVVRCPCCHKDNDVRTEEHRRQDRLEDTTGQVYARERF